MSKNNLIKIYIINLEKSIDRRTEIIKKMNLYGLNYELFNAIDGNHISDEIIKQIHLNGMFFKKLYGRNMERREAGAALSHLTLYKKIANEKIDCAIILEDDGDFDLRLKHLVENREKLEKVLRNYDLILLGYCRNDLDYKKEGECSYWKRINVDNIIKIGTPIHWYWSAIGYLLSYEGAKKLLQQGDLPVMQADFLTANSPFYNVKLGVIRKPIIWAGAMSEISTIRDKNEKLKNRTNLSYPINKKNIIKVYQKIYELKSPKILYKLSKTFYFIVRKKIKTYKLKLSGNPYQFLMKIDK